MDIQTELHEALNNLLAFYVLYNDRTYDDNVTLAALTALAKSRQSNPLLPVTAAFYDRVKTIGSKL